MQCGISDAALLCRLMLVGHTVFFFRVVVLFLCIPAAGKLSVFMLVISASRVNWQSK